MPSPDACEQCVATLSRNEQKNARHGGTVARWHGGTVARWHGGTMARWHDGTMARWHGGTVARWHGNDGTMALARWRHDGTMARWADSKAVLRPCPLHEKWQRVAVVNDGFANVSESEILTWGYAVRIGRLDRKRARRPFTTANLCHFSVFGDTIFSSRMGIP